MIPLNDKVGGIAIVTATVTGNADYDLDHLPLSKNEQILVFWDLDKEIAPVLAELPKYAREQLDKRGKCLWGEWDLFYAKGKVFTVCYGHGKNHNYYNLSQYFAAPDTGFNPYDFYGKDDFGLDAAQRLADELDHALHLMGIWAKKLSSPAAIFTDYYGKHLDLPTHNDFVEYPELLVYASNCADKEWQELIRVGHFDECYSYDKKLAYAIQMSKLLDNRPKNMHIKKSDEYQEDAYYGYCLCDIEIYSKATLHPIISADDKTGELSSRTGEWQDYLTKKQMDFIKNTGIGDYDLIDGWWLTPKTIIKPLENIVSRFSQYKEHSNLLVKDLAKRMINGFGGKFNEQYRVENKVGEFYNPMWAAEIVTGNAVDLANTIYQTKAYENIIQVKIDEFKTSKRLEYVPAGYKETSGECLAATQDTVFYGKQHPVGLDLKQAMDMMKEHPNTGYYQCGDAVIDLFKVSPTRYFSDLPHTGAELLANTYVSIPYAKGGDINEVCD